MPKDENIDIGKISIEFVQNGNTIGSTAEWEELVVNCEYQLPGEECFLVLKSTTGWSINDPTEMTKLLDTVQNMAKELAENVNIERDVTKKLVQDAETLKNLEI
jgi:hypothetical protein